MNNIILSSVIFWIALFAFGQPKRLTNLDHLDFLNEVTERRGEQIMLTHIYCEFPNYRWVDAAGEGISCVDDVARAAIVYLKHYRYYRDENSLGKARLCLNFIMQLQAQDGEFYNFVDSGLKINKSGKTSVKSVDFWAARGLWALSCGYFVFENDPAYAKRLKEHIELAIAAVERFIEASPGKTDVGFVEIPKWLVTRGADCWSIFLLGLTEYYRLAPLPSLKKLIISIADALSDYQDGSFSDFPYGAHLSWGGAPDVWHGWGNRQTQALAFAYRILGKKKWLDSAKKEATCFYTHLLVSNVVGSMMPSPVYYEQIAYTVSPIVEGFLELAESTGEKQWAILAGITCSWYFGNNPQGVRMYDPKTGRCFDGLREDYELNKNCGAESTIEALMAIMDAENNPTARRYFYLKPLSSQGADIVYPQLNGRADFQIRQPGEYFCYVHYSGRPLLFKFSGGSLRFAPGKGHPLHKLPRIHLVVGNHSLSWTPAVNIPVVVIQPVVESRTFSDGYNLVIITRNLEQGKVILLDNDQRYVIER